MIVGGGLRQRLTASAYIAAWSAMKRTPGGVSRRAFDVLAEASYHRGGPPIRQLEANLRRVLGPEASADELAAVTRAGVHAHLRYWNEVFRLPTVPPDRVVATCRLDDDDRLRAAYAAGNGVILVLPHMGNWDHAGAWCVLTGMPFTTVAERLEPAALYDRFVDFRVGLGMEVLALTGGASGPYPVLADRLHAGGMLCLLADRDLTATGVEVEFFGEAARMPAGPAALALDTGATVLPVTLWHPDDGGEGVRGRVHPPVCAPATGDRRSKVAAMTQAMADEFASSISAHPADWHMFQRVFVADLDPARLPAAVGADADGGVRTR
jgi:lauroyl/myristoyl acyltransferase